MNSTRKMLYGRFLCLALLTAAAAISRAQTLITDSFTRPNGLITNEWAYWNPTQPAAKKDAIWEMDSGSFFAQGGAGWTGKPDTVNPNVGSTNGTNSAIFRLNTKRTDIENAQITFDLLNQGLSSTAKTPQQDWDGAHIWVRYQSEYKLYYASINRRDGKAVIKKKIPGGPSNGGTYYNLTPFVNHPVPYNQWQHVKVTVQDQADGSVIISLYASDALVIQARDTGAVGGPVIKGGGRVGIRGDNANLKFDNFVVTQLPAGGASGADTTPPTVAVTAPAAGGTVSGVYTLKVDASDNVRVAGVQYQVDGANLGPEVTSAPFTQTWYSSGGLNGTHKLRAIARDPSGNKTTSQEITFTLTGARPNPNGGDATPPTVAIINPLSGQTVSGTVTLKVNAGDNVGVVGVQYLIDGANIGGEVTQAPFTLDWFSTGGLNGSHEIKAIARDAAGNKATSAPVTFNLTGARTGTTAGGDTTPPTAKITSPVAGQTVSGTFLLTISASDNVGVAGVQWQVDGVNLGTEVKTAPYSLKWYSSGGVNGTHTIRAIVRDAAGNKTTTPAVTITLTGARPSA